MIAVECEGSVNDTDTEVADVLVADKPVGAFNNVVAEVDTELEFPLVFVDTAINE